MSRSVEVVIESPIGVERVHAAFGRADYWQARCAVFDAATTVDSLSVAADGTVSVDTSQHLGRQLLPAPLAKIVAGDVKLTHGETWWPVDEDEVRGRVTVSAPGALGSGCADAYLTATETGSRLRFDATVQIKLPLVGGQIERYVARQLTDNIAAIQRFTTEWVGENGSV